MPKTDVRSLLNFLTEEEVASMLGVSVRTLRNWRLLNKGPKFRKFGSACRYALSDLDAWVESAPAGGQQRQNAVA